MIFLYGPLNFIQATYSWLSLAQMGHLLSKLNDIPEWMKFQLLDKSVMTANINNVER